MFGEVLKRLREEANMTQKELGKVLGITRPAITQLESGETQPSLKTLIDISKYFNVTTDYLLGLTDVRDTAKEDIFKDLPAEAIESIKQFIAFTEIKYKGPQEN